MKNTVPTCFQRDFPSVLCTRVCVFVLVFSNIKIILDEKTNFMRCFYSRCSRVNFCGERCGRGCVIITTLYAYRIEKHSFHVMYYYIFTLMYLHSYIIIICILKEFFLFDQTTTFSSTKCLFFIYFFDRPISINFISIYHHAPVVSYVFYFSFFLNFNLIIRYLIK